jgi:hypothetical protein
MGFSLRNCPFIKAKSNSSYFVNCNNSFNFS